MSVGKIDKLYEPARQLYVRDGQSVPEIAKQLDVSEQTLRKWRSDGEWDKSRSEHKKSARTNAEKIKEIAGKIIAKVAEKHPDDITPADMDMLAKANKMDQASSDPQELMGLAIQVITKLSRFIMKKSPDTAAAVADYIPEFMDSLRGEIENG